MHGLQGVISDRVLFIHRCLVGRPDVGYLNKQIWLQTDHKHLDYNTQSQVGGTESECESMWKCKELSYLQHQLWLIQVAWQAREVSSNTARVLHNSHRLTERTETCGWPPFVSVVARDAYIVVDVKALHLYTYAYWTCDCVWRHHYMRGKDWNNMWPISVTLLQQRIGLHVQSDASSSSCEKLSQATSE